MYFPTILPVLVHVCIHLKTCWSKQYIIFFYRFVDLQWGALNIGVWLLLSAQSQNCSYTEQTLTFSIIPKLWDLSGCYWNPLIDSGIFLLLIVFLYSYPNTDIFSFNCHIQVGNTHHQSTVYILKHHLINCSYIVCFLLSFKKRHT